MQFSQYINVLGAASGNLGMRSSAEGALAGEEGGVEAAGELRWMAAPPEPAQVFVVVLPSVNIPAGAWMYTEHHWTGTVVVKIVLWKAQTKVVLSCDASVNVFSRRKAEFDVKSVFFCPSSFSFLVQAQCDWFDVKCTRACSPLCLCGAGEPQGPVTNLSNSSHVNGCTSAGKWCPQFPYP